MENDEENFTLRWYLFFLESGRRPSPRVKKRADRAAGAPPPSIQGHTGAWHARLDLCIASWLSYRFTHTGDTVHTLTSTIPHTAYHIPHTAYRNPHTKHGGDSTRCDHVHTASTDKSVLPLPHVLLLTALPSSPGPSSKASTVNTPISSGHCPDCLSPVTVIISLSISLDRASPPAQIATPA